eukprot:COSAG06_NODE_43086_length_375_cov_0.938406_1_plen_27_part_10
MREEEMVHWDKVLQGLREEEMVHWDKR